MGNARAAIDDFVELAATKKGVAASRTLAERSTIQAAVATAESALEAARAGYYQAIDDRVAGKPGRASRCRWRHVPGCGWPRRTVRASRPMWCDRCTTSPGAARSTTAHRCNDVCEMRSPLPRTSR